MTSSASSSSSSSSSPLSTSSVSCEAPPFWAAAAAANRMRVSPFLNTPQQRKEERARLIGMSMRKLRTLDRPDEHLRRLVLINNFLRALRRDAMAISSRHADVDFAPSTMMMTCRTAALRRSHSFAFPPFNCWPIAPPTMGTPYPLPFFYPPSSSSPTSIPNEYVFDDHSGLIPFCKRRYMTDSNLTSASGYDSDYVDIGVHDEAISRLIDDDYDASKASPLCNGNSSPSDLCTVSSNDREKLDSDNNKLTASYATPVTANSSSLHVLSSQNNGSNYFGSLPSKRPCLLDDWLGRMASVSDDHYRATTSALTSVGGAYTQVDNNSCKNKTIPYSHSHNVSATISDYQSSITTNKNGGYNFIKESNSSDTTYDHAYDNNCFSGFCDELTRFPCLNDNNSPWNPKAESAKFISSDSRLLLSQSSSNYPTSFTNALSSSSSNTLQAPTLSNDKGISQQHQQQQANTRQQIVSAADTENVKMEPSSSCVATILGQQKETERVYNVSAAVNDVLPSFQLPRAPEVGLACNSALEFCLSDNDVINSEHASCQLVGSFSTSNGCSNTWAKNSEGNNENVDYNVTPTTRFVTNHSACGSVYLDYDNCIASECAKSEFVNCSNDLHLTLSGSTDDSSGSRDNIIQCHTPSTSLLIPEMPCR